MASFRNDIQLMLYPDLHSVINTDAHTHSLTHFVSVCVTTHFPASLQEVANPSVGLDHDVNTGGVAPLPKALAPVPAF